MPKPKYVSFLAIAAYCLAALSFPSDAAPPRDASTEARLASCDPAVVRKAAEEMLRDPKTLQEPLVLFNAAAGERTAGRKEEAAFLYLIARLRTSRQILFEKGDRPQLLAIMMMTVGPLVMPILEADPELARRVVRRVIEWDRATPDPYRDREDAKSGAMRDKIVEIDAGLARLPDQIRADPTLAAQAREANELADRMVKSTFAERCGPGTLDAVDVEATSERIKTNAEGFAKAHPFVLAQAGGAVKSTSVGASRQGASRLPGRMTVGVTPVTGKGFYAEVDAEVTITPGRKLDSVKFSLVCITSLWIGQRDASWKDVCVGDPKAIKPPDAKAAEFKQFDFGAQPSLQEIADRKPVCGFSDLKLPAEYALFAAGAYTGRKLAFQIDQSGSEATQIDVAVNSPDKPVVLMLGAYDPTIWNIGWSKGTRILAVLAGGYHRQAIAGLETGTPLLVSTFDNKGPCGYFYVSADNPVPPNELAKRAFGRPVDRVFPAIKGNAIVGAPMPAETTLLRSAEFRPESFVDKNAPLAGPAGLQDAVSKGLLRKAVAADADAWSAAVIRNTPQPAVAKPPRPPLYNAYVVLKPFTYPAGLFGAHSATFLIPKDVPRPEGDRGHSTVYDFNTTNCQGTLCSSR
jgi:hypothetical protein